MDAHIAPSTILFSMAIFLGGLIFVILTWINTNQQHSSRVLGLYVLFFAFFVFHDLLLYSGLIKYLPWLFRTPRPLIYLSGVLVYLYIRSVLYGEQAFRRRDYLHCIPAVLCALDMIPFYFVGPEEKMMQIRGFLDNTNHANAYARGWLPFQVHTTGIPLVNYIYVFLSGVLLYKASKSANTPAFRQNTLVTAWLKVLWALFFLFLTAYYLVFVFRAHFPDTSIIFIQALIGSSLSLSTGVALLFYPNILYGFQGRMPLQEPESQKTDDAPPGAATPEEQSVVLSDARRTAYLKALEQIMDRDRPYLKPGYALSDLAASTGIPYYYLSAVINQEYGWNFNEYINWFRVKHVKHLMDLPESNQYTLEGVAQMAGFGSRVSFSRAFNKFEGCTPTEYLKRDFIAEDQA